jgi:hypothetical protein
MSFEVMAGGGIGDMRYSHTIDNFSDYKFTTKAQKANVYLEPVLGITVDDYLELGVFSKLNAVRYYDINSTLSGAGVDAIHKHDRAFFIPPTSRLDVLFLESGFFVSGGWPKVKFNLQIGGINELMGSDIDHKTFLFRSGVSWKFDIRRVK